AGALNQLPRVLPGQELPETLQPPNCIQRPVEQWLHETGADETKKICKIVVPPVDDLFQQYRSNRQKTAPKIAEQKEDKEERRSQNSQDGARYDRDPTQG